MQEVTNFTRDKVSHILFKTLETVGYHGVLAESAVQSALWLEDRGVRGIQDLIVYMLLINGESRNKLEPRQDSKHGVTGICPFMLGLYFAEANKNWLTKKGLFATKRKMLGAPASPRLMLPILVRLASQSSRSVRLFHNEYSCLFGEKGVEFESPNFGTWGFVDTENNGPMALELTKLSIDTFQKLDQFSLPQKRLNRDEIDGPLNLSSDKL